MTLWRPRVTPKLPRSNREDTQSSKEDHTLQGKMQQLGSFRNARFRPGLRDRPSEV